MEQKKRTIKQHPNIGNYSLTELRKIIENGKDLQTLLESQREANSLSKVLESALKAQKEFKLPQSFVEALRQSQEKSTSLSKVLESALKAQKEFKLPQSLIDALIESREKSSYLTSILGKISKIKKSNYAKE